MFVKALVSSTTACTKSMLIASCTALPSLNLLYDSLEELRVKLQSADPEASLRPTQEDHVRLHDCVAEWRRAAIVDLGLDLLD